MASDCIGKFDVVFSFLGKGADGIFTIPVHSYFFFGGVNNSKQPVKEAVLVAIASGYHRISNCDGGQRPKPSGNPPIFRGFDK